mgnify:CR=1 FL=1
MNYLVKFMAVIFIIALATRVITNRNNTNCKNAIDSKQTIVVEHVDSVKNLQKNLDI